MPDTQPFVISHVEEGKTVLQARFQELGYLFFKRYVGTQDCDRMLAALVTQTGGQVSLDAKSGIPALDGRPFVEADPDWDVVYPRVQSLEEFTPYAQGTDGLCVPSGSEIGQVAARVTLKLTGTPSAVESATWGRIKREFGQRE